jgi:hypothetical protein
MIPDRQIESLNQQFDSFINALLFDVSESDLTPQKRRERRALADKDDLEFARIYFPQIFSLPWNAAHLWVADLVSGKYTLSGFRKSGKSAIVYITKAIKPIALGVGGIININASTMDISDERTASLKRLIVRNPLLCYDYDIDVQQDLKGMYIINNTYMIAGSKSTGLRNLVDDNFKRIRYQINDDLYDKNSVTSDLDNGRVVEFVESEAWGQLEDDALSITMGNEISAACPIVQLREKYPQNHFAIPALDEHNHSTWPEYRTDEEWDDFSKTIPWDVWLGEYLNRPAVKGENFGPDMIRHININLIKIVASITVCDPSHGKSPEACFKGLATLGATSSREAVALDIWLRKESYSALFDYVDVLWRRTPAWKTLLFENDFAQWDMAEPYYKTWCERNKKTLPIICHYSRSLKTEHRGSDKDSRILNLVHPHQTGSFFYSELLKGSKDFERYLQQLYGHGKSKDKLDGPDAMASAYIMIWSYIETGSFTPTPSAERKFKKLGTLFRK